MKRQILLFAASLTLAVPLAGVRPAHAETAEARQAGDVFAAPGEQSRVVTRVRAGSEMTVLSRSGRWLKVRVNGRTGWVPRSIVATEEPAATRAPRKRAFVEGRSTRRGPRASAPKDRIGADVVEGEEAFIDDRQPARPAGKGQGRGETAPADDDDDDDGTDDEPADDDAEAGDEDAADDVDPTEPEPEAARVVVVAARAVVFAEPNADAETVETLAEGARLKVLGREGGWVRVESDAGDGWVREADVAERARFRYAKRAWRVGAGLGFARLSQTFNSNSTEPLGNYKVSATSIAVLLGGELVWDYSARLLVAGDLGYRYGHATPGIRCIPERCGGDDAVDTGYKTHDLDLGAALGYKLSATTGMAAFGRLGYHYGMFKIDGVGDVAANPARFATEALQGPVIGASLDVPRLGDRWSVRASVDALWPFARRSQTVGLEDGDVSDTFATWAVLRGVYDWKDKLKATAQLSYTYAKTSWTGLAEESMRTHGATSAVRKDGGLLLVLGLMRPL